jgi:anti-sigma B factor antagonist
LIAVSSASFPPLAVTARPGEAGEVVVAVVGELDVSGAPRVREALLAALTEGAHRVTIDLSALSFIDSTGLGVLVGAYKRARSQSVDLVLTNPTRSVARVFEIAGLDKVLPVELFQ